MVTHAADESNRSMHISKARSQFTQNIKRKQN